MRSFRAKVNTVIYFPVRGRRQISGPGVCVCLLFIWMVIKVIYHLASWSRIYQQSKQIFYNEKYSGHYIPVHTYLVCSSSRRSHLLFSTSRCVCLISHRISWCRCVHEPEGDVTVVLSYSWPVSTGKLDWLCLLNRGWAFLAGPPKGSELISSSVSFHHRVHLNIYRACETGDAYFLFSRFPGIFPLKRRVSMDPCNRV